MTPEQKSKHLIKLFYSHAHGRGDDADPIPSAITCAIICCKEIITGIESIIGNKKHMWREGEQDQWEYYQSVLQHLESI
jgi:hypothetical protein